LSLKSELDLSYAFVVEKQPIGRLLFKQFCQESEESNELGICWRFLERVEEYETSGKKMRGRGIYEEGMHGFIYAILLQTMTRDKGESWPPRLPIYSRKMDSTPRVAREIMNCRKEESIMANNKSSSMAKGQLLCLQ
jgi:hypothetical protein